MVFLRMVGSVSGEMGRAEMTRLRQKYKKLKQEHERLLKTNIPRMDFFPSRNRNIAKLGTTSTISNFMLSEKKWLRQQMDIEAAHKLGEKAMEDGMVWVEEEQTPEALYIRYRMDIVEPIRW